MGIVSNHTYMARYLDQNGDFYHVIQHDKPVTGRQSPHRGVNAADKCFHVNKSVFASCRGMARYLDQNILKKWEYRLNT